MLYVDKSILIETKNKLDVISICCLYSEPFFLILEFAPFGSLKGHLDKIRAGVNNSCHDQMVWSLSPTEILTFAYQIANGMDYLASNNVSQYLIIYVSHYVRFI